MKTLKIIIITWITLFLLFYLSGCFSQASFNLSEWNTDNRLGIAIAYLFTSVIASFGIIVNENPIEPRTEMSSKIG